jgi:uncharacterized protein (DUF433 family)
MSRYALNLPIDLKRQAEELAQRQGVSLNQFILWSVAEKVGTLKQELDDPAYPNITYRRGAAGVPTPVLRGSNLRVQTVALDARQAGLSAEQIAAEYDLPASQIREALAFYDAHRTEIDTLIRAEEALTPPNG